MTIKALLLRFAKETKNYKFAKNTFEFYKMAYNVIIKNRKLFSRGATIECDNDNVIETVLYIHGLPFHEMVVPSCAFGEDKQWKRFLREHVTYSNKLSLNPYIKWVK